MIKKIPKDSPNSFKKIIVKKIADPNPIDINAAITAYRNMKESLTHILTSIPPNSTLHPMKDTITLNMAYLECVLGINEHNFSLSASNNFGELRSIHIITETENCSANIQFNSGFMKYLGIDISLEIMVLIDKVFKTLENKFECPGTPTIPDDELVEEINKELNEDTASQLAELIEEEEQYYNNLCNESKS